VEDSDEDSMEMVPIEAVPDDRDQSHCKKAKVTNKQKKKNLQIIDFSKQIVFFPKGLVIL
tara:strand:+ start:383 stop:562 length:180 start_codon:yes stop_codon:yes gene_type:complete